MTGAATSDALRQSYLDAWRAVLPHAAGAAATLVLRDYHVDNLLHLPQRAGVAARVKKSSAEFDALQINQRPAFLIENAIGDRAVFSGIVRIEPIATAIEALLADQAAYDSWKAHIGGPPSN